MKFANTTNTPIVPNIDIAAASALPRINNITELVVTRRKKEEEKSKAATRHRDALIELTEKLAEDAKNGSLKGLGGFADYDSDYMLGLEGSYLMNPESAILPVRRLERRIMDQIIEQED